MPRVWAGSRRRHLTCLAALGVLQAALALILALGVTRVLAGDGRAELIGVLAAAVIGIGGARWVERIVAERLGQSYVHEQRRQLLTAALAPDHRASLGVTVTRASNDLAAVRNWLALGIVPLVTGIPLILGVLAGLAVLDWRVFAAVGTPLLLVGLAVPALAHATFTRSRALRRRRGRLSARIADVVVARESVLASGAVRRELNAVDRDSQRVVAAAVSRSVITGLTRGATATAASLATVAVVALAAAGRLDPAGVAGAMTLLGVLATPVTDMGRVVEYRQNYQAAARILRPLNERAARFRAEEEHRAQEWQTSGENSGIVEVRDLLIDEQQVPGLAAFPGDRVHVRGSDPRRVSAVISALARGEVDIGGADMRRAPGKARRELIGVACADLPLERGSVSRLTSLRVPDAAPLEVRRVLERVGLRESIATSGKGVRTLLKNGGAPWSPDEVARLKLARALLRQPPLLVIGHLDTDLDAAGRAQLGEIILSYPGVVVFSAPSLQFPDGSTIDWMVDT
ncbi:MAG: ABC transporter ATP-binding protein [Corynebacterium sp.]|nr:ABC transporter ATP-binding protein [Corynebacterium sp.]MDO5670025.1 ABC transporter ATP-binding protein [Corynebacterium sp.]